MLNGIWYLYAFRMAVSSETNGLKILVVQGHSLQGGKPESPIHYMYSLFQ